MTTFSASFRVMGSELDPGLVSRILGLVPSQSHEKGDPNIGKSGRRYSDFSEGLWMLNASPRETVQLDDHLSFMVQVLQGRERVLEELRDLGYRMDVYIGVFGEGEGNVGFSLHADILVALAKLGLNVEFDVYD